MQMWECTLHSPTFISGRMSLARWRTAILVILLWHVLEGLKKKNASTENVTQCERLV